MMASIRTQLEQLDAKMAELQQVVDPVGFEADSVNIEIDDIDVISDIHKLFYKTMIKHRYEKIIKFSYEKLAGTKL